MNRHRWIILGVVAGLSAFGGVLIFLNQSQPPLHKSQSVTTEVERRYRDQEGFPTDILASLPSAASWTILSLRPGPYKKVDDEFHDWPVLGRLVLEDPEIAQKTISDIIGAGKKWKGGVASCFDPRHGLAATLADGRKVDFVICYECGKADLYVNGVGKNSVIFSDSDDPADPKQLNDLLTAGGVPLPKQPE